MKREIIWDKWVDPMGTNEDENDDEYKEFVGENDLSKYEAAYSHSSNVYKARVAVITPFGIVPVHNNNNPSKAFNYWVGHTNFYVGTKTFEIIDKTPGVEIVDLFSGYRFRISVARAFDAEAVKRDIEHRLQTLLPPAKITEEMLPIDPTLKSEIMKSLGELKKDKKPYWIMYVLPNSEIELSVPKDVETFNRRKKILIDTRELAGGIILSSDEYDYGV